MWGGGGYGRGARVGEGKELLCCKRHTLFVDIVIIGSNYPIPSAMTGRLYLLYSVKKILNFIFNVLHSTLLHLPPLRFHFHCVGGCHGIEPRTVATSALAVRHSNHSARSHPLSARSYPHSARSQPQLALLELANVKLNCKYLISSI